MQIFGLPGHIIRNARGASRLLAAKTPDIEVARRRDALARWRNAMAQGLTSEQAAKAVGFPRSTLYRWQKRALPLSRRPRRLRQPRRPQGLRRRRRAAAPGSSDLGQGKARPDPAQTGLRHIQRHRRAHHRRAHPARNGSARCRPDPQARRQNSAKKASPRHPQT